MARTAFTAPAHIVKQRGVTGNSQVQPDSSPSFVYGGAGISDHRMQWNRFNGAGNGALAAAVGWASDSTCIVLDQTIATAPAATTGGIVPAANAVSGTAMTLTTAATLTNGALITASALTTFPFATVIPAGTVVIQSQMAYVILGIRDKTSFYDPTNACSRVIAVTGVSGGAGGAFLVSGWDVYGQPMTELITATAGATTVNGKKAWKWIASVVPQFSDAHNYTFDVLNVFGLNIAADSAGYVTQFIAGTGYSASPSITAADATSPATTTTGDVRGTIALTPGSNRIIVAVLTSTARATATPLPSFFGVTNV